MTSSYRSMSTYFSVLARSSGSSGPVGELIGLFAQGTVDHNRVDEVILRHDVEKEDWFRRQIVDLVLGYVEGELESEEPAPLLEWQAGVRMLRACLRIRDGEFVALRRDRVTRVLCEQLDRILADGEVTNLEELLQVELQAAFGVGYDEYLTLSRGALEHAFRMLSLQAKEPGQYGDVARRQLRALEPVYRMAMSQRR